jgi:predicted RNA binding protein YcfA (HicA-like mRNA interferase family)
MRRNCGSSWIQNVHLPQLTKDLPVDMHHLCCTYSYMTGKQLKKLMEQNGWRLDRISGSHHIMVREGKRSIPVQVHGSGDLPKGLERAILKQAEIKE